MTALTNKDFTNKLSKHTPKTAPLADTPKIQTLPIDQITADITLQLRTKTSEAYVDQLVICLKNEVVLPPIVVVFDDHHYYVCDGFHRLEAVKRLGRQTIEAEVRQGTKKDALQVALEANTAHGLKLSNPDKRKKIKTYLLDEEWRFLSDREIARRVHVDNKTVAAVRRELYPETESTEESEATEEILTSETESTARTSDIQFEVSELEATEGNTMFSVSIPAYFIVDLELIQMALSTGFKSLVENKKY